MLTFIIVSAFCLVVLLGFWAEDNIVKTYYKPLVEPGTLDDCVLEEDCVYEDILDTPIVNLAPTRCTRCDEPLHPKNSRATTTLCTHCTLLLNSKRANRRENV